MNVADNVAPSSKPHGGTAATKPVSPLPADGGNAGTQQKSSGGKVALLVGAGLCFALADTRAAPLVMAVLAAGIVYQVLNL